VTARPAPARIIVAGPQSRWPVQMVMGGTTADSDWCQRWENRSPRWRHRSDGGFDPARYAVQLIVETAAKDFVKTHHYSASYPSALMRFGVFDLEQAPVGDGVVDLVREPDIRRDPGRLVGVIVFGAPEHDAVLTNVFPRLRPHRESVELKRLVMLDEVPGNAESWFTRRAIDRAAHRGVRGAVTFSDPLVRRTADGEIVMPGHVGTSLYRRARASVQRIGRNLAREFGRWVDMSGWVGRSAIACQVVKAPAMTQVSLALSELSTFIRRRQFRTATCC